MNGTAVAKPEQSHWKCQVTISIVMVGGLGLLWAIYQRGANGPLLLDDYQQLGQLLGLTDSSHAFENLFSSSGPLGRPVSMGTFILNAITLGPDVRGWKEVNIGLHLINAMLLLWLSSWVFAVIDRRTHPLCIDWLAGAACALLWAAHPLNVSTVLYLVQRMTQLATLFTILGLLSYVVGRTRQGEGRDGAWFIVLSLFVFAPLATLSKENGALTYPIVALLELVLFWPRYKGRVTAHTGAIAVVIAAIVILMCLAVGMARVTEPALSGYSDRPFTLGERVLTEARVLVMYLGQIVLPYPGGMTFYYDDIEVSKSLREPLTTTYAIAILIALAVYAVFAIRTAPAVALGIWIFMVGHSVESTVLPLELAFEHRNYLPSFGLVLAFIALLWSARVSMVVRISFVTCALMTIATLTWIRAGLWTSDTAIAAHAIRHRPKSDAAASVLAQRLTQEGRFEDAMVLLRSTVSSGRALQQLYITCISGGRIEEATLRAVTHKLDAHVTSYMLTGLLELGNLALDGRCGIRNDAMIELLNQAARRGMWGGNPNRTKIDIYRAQLMWAKGERSEAVTRLLNAYAKDKEAVLALLLAAKFSAEMGESEWSRDILQKAMSAAGDNRAYYQDLIDEVVSILGTSGQSIR
ncbi:MAG: hypothetical protein NFCOHLIN_02120 [Gammaproteobacteria bacterium]|nr:hypothetical protein [Gammaproteobacteria bacterium]